MKKSKIRTYLVPILTLIIYVLGIIFLVNPLRKSLEEISNEIKSKRAYLAVADEEKLYYERLSQEFSKLSNKRKTLENVFVGPDKTVEFIERIEAIAQETNNELTFSEFARPEAKEGGSKEKGDSQKDYFEFILKLDGTFENMIRFLNKMESERYLVEIRKFDVEQRKESSAKEEEVGLSSNAITTQIHGRVYIKVDNNE